MVLFYKLLLSFPIFPIFLIVVSLGHFCFCSQTNEGLYCCLYIQEHSFITHAAEFGPIAIFYWTEVTAVLWQTIILLMLGYDWT